MSRPILPVGIHSGDLLARYVRDTDGTRRDMDLFARAGYHFTRTWTGLSGDFWRGYELGPHLTARYPDQVHSFAIELRDRGLKWLISQGDLWQASIAGQHRNAVRDAIAAIPREVVFGCDGANEPENNGGASQQDLVDWLVPLWVDWPDVVYTLGSPVDEIDVRHWVRPPARVYDVHGYRDGHWYDKLRHIFSMTWEVVPRDVARLGIQSEPFGPGPFVSVTDNKHELDADVMQLACLVSLLSRQVWVYFPGVEKGMGRYEDQPGFWETPKAAALLPRDLMRWDVLTHAGPNERHRQWFKGTDGSMRVEQAIDSRTGRAVAVAYGPNVRAHEQTRGVVEQTVRYGDRGLLYLGRV